MWSHVEDRGRWRQNVNGDELLLGDSVEEIVRRCERLEKRLHDSESTTAIVKYIRRYLEKTTSHAKSTWCVGLGRVSQGLNSLIQLAFLRHICKQFAWDKVGIVEPRLSDADKEIIQAVLKECRINFAISSHIQDIQDELRVQFTNEKERQQEIEQRGLHATSYLDVPIKSSNKKSDIARESARSMEGEEDDLHIDVEDHCFIFAPHCPYIVAAGLIHRAKHGKLLVLTNATPTADLFSHFGDDQEVRDEQTPESECARQREHAVKIECAREGEHAVESARGQESAETKDQDEPQTMKSLVREELVVDRDDTAFINLAFFSS